MSRSLSRYKSRGLDSHRLHNAVGRDRIDHCVVPLDIDDLLLLGGLTDGWNARIGLEHKRAPVSKSFHCDSQKGEIGLHLASRESWASSQEA